MKKVRGLGVLLALMISIQSCGIGYLVRGAARKGNTVEKNVIPKEFIKSDQVLLILLWGDKTYDKYVQKIFNKRYHGPLEYVTPNDLRSAKKYADLEKYPYVFSQGPADLNLYESTYFSYSFSGSRPFHIFDRKDKTFYKSRVVSGFYGKIIEAYAMNLEECRSK